MAKPAGWTPALAAAAAAAAEGEAEVVGCIVWHWFISCDKLLGIVKVCN